MTKMNMNNNKTTITWAVVAIILFGGVWYLYVKNAGTYTDLIPGEEVATTTMPVAEAPAPAPAKKVTALAKKTTTAVVAPKAMGVGSLNQLMARKEALKCAVDSVSGVKRTGVVYVSASNKARADFAASSMIHDGTYLYAWQAGATKGLQLLASLSVAGGAIANAGGIDPATDFNFACNPWTEDATVFTSPESITFSNSL